LYDTKFKAERKNMTPRRTEYAAVLFACVFIAFANTAFAAISFDGVRAFKTGMEPNSVAIGDFNGDGKADMVVANSAEYNVSVFLGKGDGTFRPQTL
jgi:hypothetical protein